MCAGACVYCVYICIVHMCVYVHIWYMLVCIVYLVCVHAHRHTMYACVHTQTHMCLHAHVCVCMCVWQSRLKHIDLWSSLHDAEAFVFSKEMQFVRSTGPQWP